MPAAASSDPTASPLWNADLAPVPASGRKWGLWNFAALWISMAACIPTYMLASSLIGEGMNWSQAILTIFLGNVIVLVPMVLNAHAGTKYGIPFPVYCRASFGVLGANIPAMLRAFVACGWFGIQAWIGGSAIYKILTVFLPALAKAPDPNSFAAHFHSALGITLPQLACFLFFWGINMWVIHRGIDCIRWLLNIKAPLLLVLGLALLAWAYQAAGGFGPILSQPSAFAAGGRRRGNSGRSSCQRSRHDRLLGHALAEYPRLLALRPQPARSGARPGHRTALHDGALLVHRRRGDLGHDDYLRADTLGPRRCAHAFPKSRAARRRHVRALPRHARDEHRRQRREPGQRLRPPRAAPHFVPHGRLSHGTRRRAHDAVETPRRSLGYIFLWLVAYSALLGPIGGILIADYFVLRRTRLDIAGLYDPNGPYRYTHGVSLAAVVAFVIAVLPSLPGFLVQVHAIPRALVPPLLVDLYGYAWFIGFGLAFVIYLAIRKLTHPPLRSPLLLEPRITRMKRIMKTADAAENTEKFLRHLRYPWFLAFPPSVKSV